MVSITQPLVVWSPSHTDQPKRDIARQKQSYWATVSDSSRLFLGCLLVAAVGFTAFCLLKRRQVASPYISEQTEASPSPIKITALIPDTKTPAPTEGLLHYKNTRQYVNEEIREISYNDDGLPIRIVIHRHASTI